MIVVLPNWNYYLCALLYGATTPEGEVGAAAALAPIHGEGVIAGMRCAWTRQQLRVQLTIPAEKEGGRSCVGGKYVVKVGGYKGLTGRSVAVGGLFNNS